MLVTRQPVLRRFWYPVMPVSDLAANQLRSFELLEQPLVLWLDVNGQPAAIGDRCCHRSAKLSKGVVINGCVRCPYHGWSFDGQGVCTHVPQLKEGQAIPASYQVQHYSCTERYGYVWVCLDPDPLLPIPYIPEADDPAMRLLHEFDERWDCAGLRLMENSFDNAHFSFVHMASFGNQAQPAPASIEITPLDYGLNMKTTVDVMNPPLQQKNLQLAAAKTVRMMDAILAASKKWTFRSAIASAI